jgi:hypothetical protein
MGASPAPGLTGMAKVHGAIETEGLPMQHGFALLFAQGAPGCCAAAAGCALTKLAGACFTAVQSLLGVITDDVWT